MKTFKYRFITLIKNKTLIFWTLIFPILLSIFFNIAVRDIYDDPKLEAIKIGVYDINDTNASEYINTLSKEDIIITTLYKDKEKAIDDLRENDITALITYDKEFNILSIKQNMNISLLNTVFDTYNNKIEIIESLGDKAFNEEFINTLLSNNNYLNSKLDDSNTQLSSIHFFTTIAMLCLYSSFWGAESAEYLNPIENAVGVRVNISPLKKSKVILIDIAVVFTIFIIEFMIHLLFLNYILKIEVLANPLLIILTGLSCGLVSIFIGYLTALYTSQNNNISDFILPAFGLISSFLAGMNSVDIKLILEKSFPFIKYINPATLVTDNFRYIQNSSNYNIVLMNVSIMIIFSAILAIIAYRKLKVVTYECL